MTEQEAGFEALMRELGIPFVAGTAVGVRVDYYLPGFDLYVELKTWETDRLMDQLRSLTGESILVLVGPQSIKQFGAFLRDHRVESKTEPEPGPKPESEPWILCESVVGHSASIQRWKCRLCGAGLVTSGFGVKTNKPEVPCRNCQVQVGRI